MSLLRQKKSIKHKFYSGVGAVLAMIMALQIFVGPAASPVNAAATSTLTGVILVNDIQISLKWVDYLTDEKQYILERKTDSGSFVTRWTGSGNITSCVDSFETGHTYTYRVKVMDSANNIYVYTDEITFMPGAVRRPDSLTVTPVSSSQLDLKWGYPDQKAYNTIIERRVENDTNWYEIARIGIGQNTYSDTSIASGVRYYYRVKAYATDSITTTAYPDEGVSAYSLLYKPTDLYGFALSASQIQLSWKDNSAETAFIIERRSPDEGVFKQIAVVPQNNNSYIDSDTSMKPNTVYVYRIKAVTGTTSSEYSDPISITSTYLKPPGTLTSSCTDGKSIILEWIDYTDNETGFEIWRKTGSNPVWELYETMGRNARSFTDLSVTLQDNYTYKVRAKINNNSVYSDFSNETAVWAATIAAPGNLNYEVVGKTEIKLTWQDNSMVEAGYRVERKIGHAGDWYTISYLDPNTVTYNDKWINDKDTYYYRIKVFDQANSINYSSELMVYLKTPEAPSNLAGEPVSSSEVRLSWKDNSNNESGFIIEAMQFYSFREVGRVGANSTTFTHTGINPQRTYTYRVRAVSGINQSEPSNEIVATTWKNVTYSDISGVPWAVAAINNLASRNVFDAGAGSKFYPNQNIARGEYCAILIRSLGLDKVAAGKFADLTSKDKYYREIMTAARLGIISADSSNKIYPLKTVTREEAAVMLAAAMRIKGTPLPEKDPSVLKEFMDYKSISASSAAKISAAYGAGIITGRTINGKPYLQLTSNVTRAEAAVMTYNAMNLNQ